jgi:hypothetical protein
MVYLVKIKPEHKENLKQHGNIIHEFDIMEDLIVFESDLSLEEIANIDGVNNVELDNPEYWF